MPEVSPDQQQFQQVYANYNNPAESRMNKTVPDDANKVVSANVEEEVPNLEESNKDGDNSEENGYLRCF